MKKLIIVLCIALAGQIYGQNKKQTIVREMALLDKLIKAEDKGALLFANEVTVFGDIKINQNDAIKYFGDKGQLGYGTSASMLRTTITDIKGFLLFAMGISQMYHTTISVECKDLTNQRTWSLNMLFMALEDIRTSIDKCLNQISKSEGIYVGAYAQNILNLKSELRSLRQICNDILNAT